MFESKKTDGVDRRRRWSFVQSDDYGWQWNVINPDGTTQTSPSFGTMKACADDARAHGYVPWKAEEERRRDLKLKVADALRSRPSTCETGKICTPEQGSNETLDLPNRL